MPLKEFQAWGPPGGPADTYSTAQGIQDLLKKGLLQARPRPSLLDSGAQLCIRPGEDVLKSAEIDA
jgi:hypothetical protein